MSLIKPCGCTGTSLVAKASPWYSAQASGDAAGSGCLSNASSRPLSWAFAFLLLVLARIADLPSRAGAFTRKWGSRPCAVCWSFDGTWPSTVIIRGPSAIGWSIVGGVMPTVLASSD